MSFITKRERVFNEYDLFDLPARNEGKLKAYSSCTDARAWSHFCSDKTEHLVDIIKRNNETVRPKYVPTEIIVNTLMISKNAEIARLKRKIEEFEQMLAAYDQLELTCDQKCDIANAHAAIKAANKELDDMCLDLDLSGYTEGIDSEAFETGKSRGDEILYSSEIEKSRGDEWLVRKESTPRMETKSNQFGESCTCDASTSAYDTRIDDLQGSIISKDAKLSAMQNTIAVMENDVCEPYCVYAHIYTALEKIFGTLCQNEKYKEYLDLLTAGKDTRGIDIKGKILFKIKVLEKFSLALIAPCTQEYSTSNDCSCYHAKILTQVQTTFALTSSEIKNPQLDNKRAQLIADIMQNDDIKEIMNNGSFSTKLEDGQIDECYILDNYNIDDENLKRLKNLQSDYEDLLNCYDNLKHERDCLNIRCQKYIQLEHECECLQNKLREYKQLWKEKEYYRNRSEDLDALKENYLVLADETSNVETKLRAEQEISKVKSRTVDELRNENIKLDSKLTEVSLVFEKQKNMLICKLKEYECKIMCQEQQIKSLSIQIDGFLDKDAYKTPIKDESQTLVLFDEIQTQKEQIKNLKDALCCNEEEKKYYQEEFENQLKVINQLKLAVEDWKSKYEKALQSKNYLEKYLEDVHVQMNNYQENNRLLNTEIEKKASAIDNLNEIIDSKSQEVNHLIDEVDRKKKENEHLVDHIKSIHDDFNKNLQLLENEREIALASIHSAREESIEVLENIKNYVDKRNDIDEPNTTNKEKEIQINEIKRIESLIQENKKMNSSNIIKEFELLREINIENINILRCENEEIKKSFELSQKQSEMLNKKLMNQDNLIEKLQQLTKSHETLMHERDSLQAELHKKTNDVNKVLQHYELTEKKSKSLLDQLNEYECKYLKLHETYKKIESERNDLQKEVVHAEALSKELNRSETIITNLNDTIFFKTKKIEHLKHTLFELSKKFDSLQEQNQVLQKNFDDKCNELKKLGDILEKNIEENRILSNNNNILKIREMAANKNIEELKKEKSSIQVNLDIIKKESSERLDKLQHYKNIENQYNDLMIAHHKIESEKKILHNNLQTQLQEFNKLQQEHYDLNNQNKTLVSLNEELEKSLIRTREQAISHTDKHISYTNVKLEIDKLKAEKATCNNKISRLQDKLDESEYYINNLNEDILARDKKITTLENHINSLEDEIRKLQFNLDEVVQSGEEIKNLSFEKIDKSRNLLEAHYSKARHNLKLDLVKLQDEKCKLEEQLSKSELVLHESCVEKQSFINKLQQEREQIISEIQQLEINIFKESKLNPKCTFIEVINALERIGKFLDVKNTSLEKTLLNVQDSYQILKSKAEEAKNIAEKERQKIIDEKEEMNKERKFIEDQLLELRNKIEADKVMYENVIKDLNGEISNQNLIFDKIKEIKENEILKLKEEKQSLHDLNAKLLVTQKDLEEKLYKQRNDNKNIQNLFEKVSFDLESKNMEILSLQKTMDDLKNKSTQELGTQAILDGKKKEVSTETDVTEKKLIDKSNNVYSCEIISELNDGSDSIKPNNGLHSLKISELLDTENIESSINLLKCIYINYKTKRLRIGRLEQYSITGIKIVPDNNVYEFQNNSIHKKYCIKSPSLKESKINSLHKNDSIVSIYNTKVLTDSTRNTYEIDNYISSAKTESMKSSAITELALNNEIFETDNDSKNNVGSNESPISTDKDLFLIYEDSQNNSVHTQKPWSTNGYANIIVERATVHTNQKHQLYEKNKLITTNKIKENKYYEGNIDEPSEDDSIKPKLNVKLPRVLTDTFSTTTISDDEKISTDTYMRGIYATPRRKVFSDTNISVQNHKNNQLDVPSTIDNPNDDVHESKNKFINYADSAISVLPEVSLKSLNKIQEIYKDTNTDKKLSKLTRTNAKTQILKYKERKVCDERGINEDIDLNSNPKYNDLNINKNVDFIKFFSKSISDNKLDSEDKLKAKINKESNSLKNSSSSHQLSTEYSLISFSPHQIKSAIDRAILVKLDIIEDYEKKILQLTQALENTEKDYKNKMEAIKVQYDCNVKRIINEHNQGVESIQSLHEEKLCDIIKIHDNEIENLRAMSIEALRKVEKLENENHYLKSKLVKYEFNFDEIPVKIPTPDLKRKKDKCKLDDKTLTKTNVSVLDVKPKRRSHGPCTCTIDINVSDTIRNIFDQVDIEQRKMAEQTYLKYIANKILSENVEVLDAEELSFLHLKVCRTWKTRLNKEETLQKRIDSLECELINKQRQTHKHMAELDRKVAQEWKRLQEVREAVCCSPHNSDNYLAKPVFSKSTTNIDINIVADEKLPASEHEPELSCICGTKRIKSSNRAVLAKLDAERKKEKYHCNDETPIRLKRLHEHHAHKK